jgi:chemotaxis protein methyltransferase CheR
MSKEYLPNFYAILEEHTGIALDDTKQYLIESRLLPLSKKMGHQDIYAFIKTLVQTPIGHLHWQAFESLTTNETSFFRDKHVFEGLKNHILPLLIASRRKEKTLRIWNSAVSAGQEAYSVAIMLRESFPELYDWNLLIQATDISDLILEKARSGIYSTTEAKRGLDQYYLDKYFTKVAQDSYQINPSIRAMVNFLPHNLVGVWPFYPKFDLIMLRNVLIYFNQDTKNKVLEKMHKQLNNDNGILILGASESIYMNDLYKLIPLEKISYYKVN